MSEEGGAPNAEQATCLSLRPQLTPLAKTLLWLSGSVILLSLLSTNLRPTPFILAFTSLLLLLFACSWWVGRISLGSLIPDGLQPATGFAWERLPIRFALHHVGERFKVRDVLLLHGSDGNERGMFGYRASIEPGESMWVDGSLRLPRRGRFRSHGLRLISTFPFGLLRWTASWHLPADLIALPRLGALRDATSLIPNERETVEAGAGRFTDTEEFHTLKKWRPGMSQRLVHWKSTARRGHLMVREMHGVRFPRLRVELIPPALGKDTDARVRRRFEESICLAATLADFFLRKNYRVEFATMGVEQPFYLEAQRGRHALFQILTRLADVQLPRVDPIAEKAGIKTPPPLGLHIPRSDCFRIQVCAGAGNKRDVGRHRLDVTSPATKRWFQANRRFSTGTFIQSRRA
ncbi:MAG: DUF58 domain-containing protein [Planctomycetes bacterium]|nr:DUF58 domain-containing protein [Planctomycetota bacterium]MCP4771799.1 DUF58 domain-containing protein [Planctomycetota bacterium]MCP4860958.1 DUF58 domain-containing protein [Planctomycetota bacterium]